MTNMERAYAIGERLREIRDLMGDDAAMICTGGTCGPEEDEEGALLMCMTIAAKQMSEDGYATMNHLLPWLRREDMLADGADEDERPLINPDLN